VSMVARFPSVSLNPMTVGMVWWLFSPLAKMLALFHACFGVKIVWCIALAWCIDHAALASAILSVTSVCADFNFFQVCYVPNTLINRSDLRQYFVA